jgi:hypothetical protein
MKIGRHRNGERKAILASPQKNSGLVAVGRHPDAVLSEKNQRAQHLEIKKM